MNTTAARAAGSATVGGARPLRRQSGRVASAVETVVVVGLIVAVALAIVGVGQRSVTIHDTTTVRVESGDTLWEIAAAHPVQGATTHELVSVISELNGLDGGDLRIGQTLRVPAATNPDVALASR